MEDNNIIAAIIANDIPDDNIVKGYAIHSLYSHQFDYSCRHIVKSRKVALEIKRYYKNKYGVAPAIRPIIRNARLCMEFGGIDPDDQKSYNNYEKLLKKEGPARAGYRRVILSESKDALVAYNIMRIREHKNPCSIKKAYEKASKMNNIVFMLMFEKYGSTKTIGNWTRKNAEIISSASDWEIFKACNYDKDLASFYIQAKTQMPINYLY